MNETTENNIKIKLIALMSAVVLWMYVMAIVDPEDTKNIENISVRIENKDEIDDNDLIIYPNDVELVAGLSVSGKLSDIKSITKKDIVVNGRINEPIEGINEVYLSASTPQGVSYKFKERILFVNLEKVIEDEKIVEIVTDGKYKDNVETIKLKDDKEKIKVIGPRSLVENVEKIQGHINIEENSNISQEVFLQPVDIYGNVVEGVSLEQSNINTDVIVFSEKEVPVVINIKDENISYELNDIKIKIKGESQVIDKINFIETEDVSISDIFEKEIITTKLKEKENIKLSQLEIQFKISDIKNIVKFEYTKNEIETKNSDINLPNKVILIGKYESVKPIKSDVKLYIDNNKDITFDSKVLINDVIIYEENS